MVYSIFSDKAILIIYPWLMFVVSPMKYPHFYWSMYISEFRRRDPSSPPPGTRFSRPAERPKKDRLPEDAMIMGKKGINMYLKHWILGLYASIYIYNYVYIYIYIYIYIDNIYIYIYIHTIIISHYLFRVHIVYVYLPNFI